MHSWFAYYTCLEAFFCLALKKRSTYGSKHDRTKQDVTWLSCNTICIPRLVRDAHTLDQRKEHIFTGHTRNADNPQGCSMSLWSMSTVAIFSVLLGVHVHLVSNGLYSDADVMRITLILCPIGQRRCHISTLWRFRLKELWPTMEMRVVCGRFFHGDTRLG